MRKKVAAAVVAIGIIHCFAANTVMAAESMDNGLLFVPENKKVTDYLEKDVAVYVDEVAVREHKKKIQYVYDPSLLNGDYMELMKSSADANGYDAVTSTANKKAEKEAYALVDDVSIKDKVNYIEIGAKGYFYDYVNLSGFDSGTDVTIVSVMYDLAKKKPVTINGRYLVAKQTVKTKGFVSQNITMPYQYIVKKLPKSLINETDDNDSPINFNLIDTKANKVITSNMQTGSWTALRTVIVDNQMVLESKEMFDGSVNEVNRINFIDDGEKSGDIAHTVMASKPVEKITQKQAVEDVRKRAEIQEKESIALEKRLAEQAKGNEPLPPLSSSSPTEMSHSWLHNIVYYFFK